MLRPPGPVALVLLALAPLTGGACHGRGAVQPDSTATASTASASARYLPNPALALAGAHGVSIADVAERALPSVVNISSTRHAHAEGGGQRERGEMKGLGSGVIVAPSIVLTNNHVVAEADEVRITTSDKHEFKVTVVGTDPKSDLAVLKVDGEPSGLVPIELGDSARLRLGDVVLAIGNPFGVGQTVTMGIVSAMGRAEVGIVDYEDFIQTDAAINPGNSGGALIDMEGRLVGINTAILSRSGGSMGIGFAIPSNMAKPIMDSLLAYGRVVRGWLGIGADNIDAAGAKVMALGRATGVVITDVDPRGPGYRAGLKKGDVVLRVDGHDIDSYARLRIVIASLGVRKGVKVEVLRGNKALALTADLEEMPGEQPAAPSAGGGGVLDGLTLDGLTTATRQRFSIPAEVAYGVAIVGITPGSAAARAGLREGDVLLEVNREHVDGVSAFRELYAKAQREVLLLVYRQGGTFFVIVHR